LLKGKRILLVISGGIAAYKALELIRRLRERGASVRCVLSRSAAHFVTPLSVSALSGDKVYGEIFSLTDEAEMGHIQLSRDADLLVVAPASADLLARMAAGMADDLAATVLLATDKPVLVAPAMNVRMWTHPATQRNVAQLQADGVQFVGPVDGAMACNEYGPGRMSEPMEILAAIEAQFAGGIRAPFHAGAPDALTPITSQPLAGKKVIVTSGPTHEPIDPVRYIANRSSGKQGHAIATALAQAGADVILVSGPVNLPDPKGVRVIRVETARDMFSACFLNLPADAAIFAAAVADWRVAVESDKKLKKTGDVAPSLQMAENPDILRAIANTDAKRRPALVVGFAAETDHVVDYARAKLDKKACDWILANDASPQSGVFGGDENTVHLVTRDGVEDWPRMSKQAVAEKLTARIADFFKSGVVDA